MPKRSHVKQAQRILQAAAKAHQNAINVQNPNRVPPPIVIPAPAVIAPAPAPTPAAPAPLSAIVPATQVAPPVVVNDTPDGPQTIPASQFDTAPAPLTIESTENEIKEDTNTSSDAANLVSPQSNPDEGNGKLSYPDSDSDSYLSANDSNFDFSDIEQPGLDVSDDDSEYDMVTSKDATANNAEEQKAIDDSQQLASSSSSLMDSANLPSLRDFIRRGLTFSHDSRSFPTINSNMELQPKNDTDSKSPNPFK